MRIMSIVIVAAALVLAGLVYFVVPRFMNHAPPVQQVAQQAPPPGVEVLVAAQTLPAGTILKADDLRWQRWPEDKSDGNYLTKDKGADAQRDAVGRVVLRGFMVGEPITPLRLLKPGEAGFLAAALAPGMRAVTVKIDPVSGDAGFVVPGDHVDAMLNEKYEIAYGAGPETSTYSGARPMQKNVNSVILEDVRVLAIDQNTQDVDSKPKLGTTATLELDPVSAQKLALASQMGSVSLALRSLVHDDIETKLSDPVQSVVQDVDVSPFLGSLRHTYVASANVRVYHGAATGTQR
jgi:pilus assembly protein CpaB